jgi:hypothetical protein
MSAEQFYPALKESFIFVLLFCSGAVLFHMAWRQNPEKADRHAPRYAYVFGGLVMFLGMLVRLMRLFFHSSAG